ncbi:MAG: glycoside hydrolase family 9 protein [Eubacterium sp.]|nr:glycoside hydrolase family 9 protein [Eubacterium sp.]
MGIEKMNQSKSRSKNRIIAYILSLIMLVSMFHFSSNEANAASVEINFAKLLQESLYFYDANMCGQNVSSRSAFSWRSNCHAGDTSVNINGWNMDVSGGFHDAGDHLKAGLPQAYAATILGVAYYEYKQAFIDTGSAQHLQTITNHFCEYFERCTAVNSDGTAAFFVYQVSDGDEDHSKWEAPENQNAQRHVYYTSDSNPATDEVSEAAAALTLQYLNFGDTKALDYAKKLFNYAYSHSGACATEGLYDSSTGGYLYESKSWGDDYALAAALLYKATGESWYQTEFYNTKNASSGGYNIWSWFSWDNVSMLADYYGTGNAQALLDCANNMYGGMNTNGGYGCLLQWGSARYNCNTSFLGLLYDKVSGTSEYADWSTNQMRYLMGENSNNQCYIVGYNSYSSKYPHHRAASASNDAGVYSDNRHTLLGALVGGPKDTYGNYTDSQTDYVCNEVAIDYNAGLVACAAALYTLHKGDGTASETLMTAEELSAAGVELRFSYSPSGEKKEGSSGASGGTASSSNNTSSNTSNNTSSNTSNNTSGNTSNGAASSASNSNNGYSNNGYSNGGNSNTGYSNYSNSNTGYSNGSGSGGSNANYVPHSEWINGQYYSADGGSSYQYKGSWKANSTGWWFEDQAGWYPYSQWQKIDYKWYYFDYYGYMASSEWRDGYYISSDGSWTYEYVGSWHNDGYGWWFGDTSGWYASSCWQKINGQWYYFDANGYWN